MSSATHKTGFCLKRFNISKFRSVTGRVSTTGRVTLYFYMHKKQKKEYPEISYLCPSWLHIVTFFKDYLATFAKLAKLSQHLATKVSLVLIKEQYLSKLTLVSSKGIRRCPIPIPLPSLGTKFHTINLRFIYCFQE